MKYLWLLLIPLALIWLMFARPKLEEVQLNEMIEIEGEGINFEFPDVTLVNGVIE